MQLFFTKSTLKRGYQKSQGDSAYRQLLKRPSRWYSLNKGRFGTFLATLPAGSESGANPLARPCRAVLGGSAFSMSRKAFSLE